MVLRVVVHITFPNVSADRMLGPGVKTCTGLDRRRHGYRQILAGVEKLRGRPEVQRATETIQDAVIDLSERTKGAVNAQVEKVTSETGSTQ